MKRRMKGLLGLTRGKPCCAVVDRTMANYHQKYVPCTIEYDDGAPPKRAKAKGAKK